VSCADDGTLMGLGELRECVEKSMLLTGIAGWAGEERGRRLPLPARPTRSPGSGKGSARAPLP
jgi:hypothetical protein